MPKPRKNLTSRYTVQEPSSLSQLVQQLTMMQEQQHKALQRFYNIQQENLQEVHVEQAADMAALTQLLQQMGNLSLDQGGQPTNFH